MGTPCSSAMASATGLSDDVSAARMAARARSASARPSRCCWNIWLCHRGPERLEVLPPILVVVQVVLDRRELARHLVVLEPLRRPGTGARRRIALEALGVSQRLALGTHEPPHVELAGVLVRRAIGHDVALPR